MRWFALLLFLVSFLPNCATLRDDPNPPAGESNFPTAEFWAGGSLHHGIARIQLEKGMPYDDIDLKVQGYFRGVIRVDSQRCGVAESVLYENNALVPIKIKGVAGPSCIYNIAVVPEYPGNPEDSPLQTYELIGQLLVKVVAKETKLMGKAEVLMEGVDFHMYLPLPPNKQSKIALKGCGVNYVKSIFPAAGSITLSFREMVGDTPPKRCFIEGAAVSGDDVWRYSWVVWNYSSEHNPLTNPMIESTWYGLRVQGDPTVSVISLDDKYELGIEASFAGFDEDADHVLRVLTVKGRSVVCQWDKRRKTWQCLK